MMKINVMIILSGLITAFYSGLLVKMICNTINNETADQKLPKALYCMILFGSGEVVGSYLIGKAIDRFSNKFGVATSLVVFVVTIALTLYTHSRNNYDAFWFVTLIIFPFIIFFFIIKIWINKFMHKMKGFEIVTALLWGLADSISSTSVNSIC